MTARSILVLLVTLAIASSSEWAVRYDGPAHGADEARAKVDVTANRTARKTGVRYIAPPPESRLHLTPKFHGCQAVFPTPNPTVKPRSAFIPSDFPLFIPFLADGAGLTAQAGTGLRGYED